MENNCLPSHKFVFFVGLLSLIGPVAAYAYVGPGAGLTMLGALWAVIAAIVLALFGLFLWPVRAFLARRNQDSFENDESGLEQPELEQPTVEEPADSVDAK